MKNKILFFTSAVFILIPQFFSCSKSTSSSANVLYNNEAPEEEAVFASAAPRMMMAKTSSQNSLFAEADEISSDTTTEISSETSQTSESSQTERKLIKNGDLSLQVQNLDQTESAVENLSKKYGGYVSSSTRSERGAFFTVKIPYKNFDLALKDAGSLGSLKNRSISTRDVSEQYYDLKTRLETKKILQSNLQNYLKQATNLSDILKIEKELNNVTSDIESMEGQFRRLSQQIEFSTININFYLPEYKESNLQQSTFSEIFLNFTSSLKTFFAVFIKILLYLVICGIPLTAAAAFFYWLLFGHLGLIKKLFKKLK